MFLLTLMVLSAIYSPGLTEELPQRACAYLSCGLLTFAAVVLVDAVLSMEPWAWETFAKGVGLVRRDEMLCTAGWNIGPSSILSILSSARPSST